MTFSSQVQHSTGPLPCGSPEFIGLGFLSFVSLIVTELFGSPFLKNTSIVAGAAGYLDGCTRARRRSHFSGSLALEAIGDITPSAELSRVDVRGLEFDSCVQRGVLGDAIGGFFSSLFPLLIFAQCCVFLILFGVLGKISGALLASLWVLSFTRYSRRDRFVLAALSSRVGDLLVPQLFMHLFDGMKSPNSALQGFFDSITITLSTPFLAVGIVGVILNIILPREPEGTVSEDMESDAEKQLESQQGSGE
ncbi:hypothetical protein C8R46DRAFT_1317880 [Mycena filopes]|nr:hypothetical protein C8R46DRAFT_1317880 [Mycena filopes]